MIQARKKEKALLKELSPMSRCFVCGEDNPNVLETHHVIPRRYGGRDSEENLVTLCANCHSAIESLYGRRFYERLAKRLYPEEEDDPDPGGEADAPIPEPRETVVIEGDGEEGLIECPVCGRTENRRGAEFEIAEQVASHIDGSHDDDHSGLAVKVK